MNGFQGIGKTKKEILSTTNLVGKFKSFGWNAKQIDGHNHRFKKNY